MKNFCIPINYFPSNTFISNMTLTFHRSTCIHVNMNFYLLLNLSEPNWFFLSVWDFVICRHAERLGVSPNYQLGAQIWLSWSLFIKVVLYFFIHFDFSSPCWVFENNVSDCWFIKLPFKFLRNINCCFNSWFNFMLALKRFCCFVFIFLYHKIVLNLIFTTYKWPHSPPEKHLTFRSGKILEF